MADEAILKLSESLSKDVTTLRDLVRTSGASKRNDSDTAGA